MKKFLATIFFLALFLPLALMAQDPVATPVTFDLAVVLSIITTGIAGVPVAGLVEIIKRMFKIKDKKALLVVFVVSAGAVTAYLVPLGLFSVQLLIGYTVFVFGEASGLYKMVKKPKIE